jgi:hypothetical protein
MQVGLMDAAVPNLGSWYHARALGLGVVTPTPLMPWGLEPATGASTSGLFVYDFKLGDVDAFYRVADFPADNEVHEGLRRLAAAKRQVSAFFRDGSLVSQCEGPCDPE